MPAKYRLIVIDDDPLLRSALKALLDSNPDLQVVGDAEDGAEAVQVAQQLRPDLALLDMMLPRSGGGEETARSLKQAVPEMKVLALSAHEDRASMTRMLEAGADAYAPKSRSPAELLKTIRQVLAQPGPATESRVPTAEEVEVLKRFSQGYPLKQIADDLGLDLDMVERHKAVGMRKLELKTRLEVARYAKEQGWL